MTSRDRLLTAWNLRQPDRVPIELDATRGEREIPEAADVVAFVDNEADNFGLSTFGSLDWQMAIKHRLGLEAAYGTGLEGSYYWEYSVLLKYTYIFGSHSGIWRE